jgi:hypothetical protein
LAKNVFDYDVLENMAHNLNEQKIFLNAEGTQQNMGVNRR